MTKNEIRDVRKIIAARFGVDFKTNFFEKSFNEIALIDQVRQACGFKGENYSGRSKARQFYDYLCKGELPF